MNSKRPIHAQRITNGNYTHHSVYVPRVFWKVHNLFWHIILILNPGQIRLSGTWPTSNKEGNILTCIVTFPTLQSQQKATVNSWTGVNYEMLHMYVTTADANGDFHSLSPSCSAYLVSISTCDVLLLVSSTCENWLVCFSCTSFTLDSSSVNFALNHSIVRLSTVSWPANSFPDVSSTRLLSNVKGTGEAGVVLNTKVLITCGKNASEFQKIILLQF